MTVFGAVAMWIWTNLLSPIYAKWIETVLPFHKKPASGLPQETVKLIRQWRTEWQMGTSGERKSMLLFGKWHATNITDQPAQILKAELPDYDCHGVVSIEHPVRNEFGEFSLLPGRTREMDVMFFVEPPIRNEGQDFICDVVFTDRLGNRYREKDVNFQWFETLHHLK